MFEDLMKNAKKKLGANEFLNSGREKQSWTHAKIASLKDWTRLFCLLQTCVGKLKFVCGNGTKTVGKHACKQLATNTTCIYSRKLFLVNKLVSDM